MSRLVFKKISGYAHCLRAQCLMGNSKKIYSMNVKAAAQREII